jgi:hypothetical protein
LDLPTKKDLAKIGMNVNNEDEIIKLTKNKFKATVKEMVRKHAFKELEHSKSNYSKVKDIKHKNLFNMQNYLTFKNFNQKM